MNLTLKDIEDVQRQINELKAQIEDKFKDLKQAYAEGAIIEHRNNADEHKWRLSYGNKPDWTAPMYRIKDEISIASWNKHKDVIKQFWNGAKVEVKIYKNNWLLLPSKPNWNTFEEYRIKQDKFKLPEYEDGSPFVVFLKAINSVSGNDYTASGRRRATRKLAKRCAKASKERDLLEAYRDHLEPDYVDPDWDDANINKYYIYIHKDKYIVDYNFNAKDLGKVYGSKETMQKICDALNNKEINLD